MQVRSQQRDNLPSDHHRGRNCGCWCTIGLSVGLILFTGGLAFPIVFKDFDTIISNLTSCTNQDNDSEDIASFIGYLISIDIAVLLFNIAHVCVVLYGFKALIDFRSDFSEFRFTDVFYCLSCVGSVIFLSFSGAACIATTDKTVTINWVPKNSSSDDSNNAYAYLVGEKSCASEQISDVSNSSLVYVLSQLIQIWSSSTFILHAGQMLPHGRVKKNKAVSEVIQFLGVTHFFLWIINSFVYSPNIFHFYVVEAFYFGKSSFSAISKLTFPIIVFYHFATALRCINLYSRYESLP